MSHAISVFGLGYVGTVTAACLAHKGNHVIGVDLNPLKVEAIESRRSPIVEPQVGELITECHKDRRLHATCNSESAVLNTEITFLCVGTPSLRNGRLDLGHVEPVCRQIGEALKKKSSFHLVVLRSTVLPGTAESIVIPALEHVLRDAEVVVIGKRDADYETLRRCIRPGQIVIDLVNLEKARRVETSAVYKGICW